jgi:hypothetical protein
VVLKEALTRTELGLAGMVLASPLALRFAQYLEHQPSLCPLQEFAGMACPSCGGTRAVFYIWGADPLQAMRSNIGVTLFILGIGGFLVAGKVEVPGLARSPGANESKKSVRIGRFFAF